MTQSKDNAFSKLAKVQAELNAPKGQFNKFGGYNYRNCEDILQAVKPLLDGAVILISDEVVLIGDRYYIKATASFNYNGMAIENSALAREPLAKKGMDEAQITGATSSYARKYALNGLLLIDDNKDADTQNNKGNCSVTNQPQLLKVIGDGDEIAVCDYWRSLNQEQQQFEWKQIDKETQKYLKGILKQYPANIEADHNE